MNVAGFLREAAARDPGRAAIVSALAGGGWSRLSFEGLERLSDQVAAGLQSYGVRRGDRALLMLRPGAHLIGFTYALFKLGAVPVLIDPGMGRPGFLSCVAQARPRVLVGIPMAHLLRRLFPAPFRTVERCVTLGTRWLWGGTTLERLARDAPSGPFPLADCVSGETAAILFTSGSTGPAKGTLYTHDNFAAQVRVLLATYRFEPGEVDLAAFPLFSLFDCSLGMTSVIPELDPSRPAQCDPRRIVAALQEHRCTTAFGSPAIWRRVAPWCLERGLRLPDLRRVLIAGASVPPALIEQLHRVVPHADVFTPYGATEALPVASIGGREVMAETACRSREGAGTCVGRPVSGIDVRIIRISDDPIPSWSEALCVGAGAIGEICVKGPLVTRGYLENPGADTGAKIPEGDSFWHRMGDLGFLDEQGRLWFSGRKSERVQTARGPLFTEPFEGIVNAHPKVARSALVGVGQPGAQRPVLVVEGREDRALAEELRRRAPVAAVLFHPRFPVDRRHNAKIHRHALKAWAERRLGSAW